ncbi:hypothetical protein F4694_000333 [Bacillus niacini]|uniref:Uncharacterized protein n=1 Tax=Neobacillus niacini TaxID=86668 RepID=A0A852T821_9BACI|nr:hypothetical protein [Neobacillus niacini]
MKLEIKELYEMLKFCQLSFRLLDVIAIII